MARHIEFLDRGVVNSNYQVDLGPGSSDKAKLSGVWPPWPATVRLRLTRSAEATDREAAIARLLAGRNPTLAPTELASERLDVPEPHTASLWSWLVGASLEELTLDHAGQVLLAVDLAAALGQLHDETLHGFGRLNPDLTVARAPGFDRPALRWLDDLARRIAVRLENPAHGLAPAVVSRLKLAVARAMAPLWSLAPVAGTLVHGDLSSGNIIIRMDDGHPRLAGLLDWEMARSADPVVDAVSADFELTPRWPVLAAHLIERLRTMTPEQWDRRFDLASMPLLLDSRMVARVRHAELLLVRLDVRLNAIIEAWAG